MVIFSESELFGLGSMINLSFLASMHHPITIQWDGQATYVGCFERDCAAHPALATVQQPKAARNQSSRTFQVDPTVGSRPLLRDAHTGVASWSFATA
jgi:hypothetical protein